MAGIIAVGPMARPRPTLAGGSYPETLGRERRRALGTYYTPARIVHHLARVALAPALELLRAAVRRAGPERLEEALALRVLDPAMGDGAFLRAAADLIAWCVSRASGLRPEEVRPAVVARCLHGLDIDPEALELARAALGEGRERAALAAADALAAGPPPLPGPAAFDLIIGNPPWGGWNRRLDRESKRLYRERFATARGLLDPCVLFVERATQWLAPGGRLAFVLPDYFLLKNYPAARRHVLDHYRIEELARWGRAFPGVNLDACTLVATRLAASPAPRSARAIRCLPEGPGGRVLLTPQSRFERSPGFVFNIALDSRGASLLRRLERDCFKLGDLVEAHEGIHSGNIRPKLFVPPGGAGRPGGGPTGGDPRLRPLILGREEIRPFRLIRAGWQVVYDRRIIRRDRGEYANLGEERWFASPKILVRRTGDHVMAALDLAGLFASNNLFVALARPGCPVPLEYLEACLNSSLATWCFRAMQPRAGRLFAELKLAHLSRLPVPRPPDDRAIARIVSLAARIRRRMAAGGPGAALAALDAAFADLARLTPAQARLVERRSPPRAHSL